MDHGCIGFRKIDNAGATRRLVFLAFSTPVTIWTRVSETNSRVSWLFDRQTAR